MKNNSLLGLFHASKPRHRHLFGWLQVTNLILLTAFCQQANAT